MFYNKNKKRVSTLTNDRRFGTDGIRGPVDTTMNPLFVTKLGWAAGATLSDRCGCHRNFLSAYAPHFIILPDFVREFT